MCILIASTRHSEYPLIILSNRDEFIQRPTAPAHFWSNASGVQTNILGPTDLARDAHGTWIGITTSGRFAVTLNYRDKVQATRAQISNSAVANDSVDGATTVETTTTKIAINTPGTGPLSRGVFPKLYLESLLEPREWCGQLLEVRDGLNIFQADGFSLLCGHIKKQSGKVDLGKFQVVSNRGSIQPIDPESELGGKTFCLSNSHLAEKPEWPKITLGKALLNEVIDMSLDEEWSRTKLIEELFKILSHDTFSEALRDSESLSPAELYALRFESLAKSVFIPPFSIVDGFVSSGATKRSKTQQNLQSPSPFGEYYGTRTQTIILVDKFGKVIYNEKNLQSKGWPQIETPPITNVFEFEITAQ
ncbi:DUF833-domain-containing protein [Nadsonia fulvescens var. elongata DSM 6958]|uniref:DUF833-domain-containing protein n=1 Tax=Nadsonia fulvescens var. elongata DSM 6958 TaxID=857566 RepID=A0A1E3PL78_9ASCO|nr:DUF833-domain-containing protein [Nadsonia fulvescens var. elongata DSM 6958]